MGELPNVTPQYFQILVIRELRKAGFDVGEVRIHRRSELPEPQRGFVLELTAPLAHADWHKRALVACRRQDDAVGREVVDALKSRLQDARAEVGIVFTAGAFRDEGVAAAQQAGVALLRVIDGRKAYDGGQYGAPGHYPAWLPAHTVEVVDRDPGGRIRARLLEPGGGAAMVLAAFEAD
jgi:hypothetical protein